MTRTVVLLEARPLWRSAFERLLGTDGIRVVASAADPDYLIDVIAEQTPDVVIIDVEADDAERALEAIRRTCDLYPAVRTVAFGQTADDEQIDAAFTAGARVFCLKTAEPGDLLCAVRQAFRNSIFVARAHAGVALRGSGTTGTTARARLTKRELQILRFVAEGQSNAEVAKALWVTEQTIKFHLSNIYRKLDVANRTEASRWAQLNGMLFSAAPVTGML